MWLLLGVFSRVWGFGGLGLFVEFEVTMPPGKNNWPNRVIMTWRVLGFFGVQRENFHVVIVQHASEANIGKLWQNKQHTHTHFAEKHGKCEVRPGFLFSANLKIWCAELFTLPYLEQAAPAEMFLPITSPLLAGSRRTTHLRLCALAEALLYTSQSGSGTHSSPNRWLRVEWNYALYNLLVAAIKVQIKVQYVRSAYTRTELYHWSTIVILWFIWS